MNKIAFLVAHMSKGGMQKCMSNFSMVLPSNIEHEILYFGTENPEFPFHGKEVDLDISGKKTVNHLSRLFNFFKRIRKLQQHIRSNKIETVVSFGEVANIINVLVPKKRTILAVQVDIQRSLASGWYNKIYKLLVYFLYRRADKVVAISQNIARDLVDFYKIPESNVVCLCNVYDFPGVVIASQEEIPSELLPVFDHPVIINIANLNRQKGQQHLINSFKIARESVDDLQLVIIGRGNLEDDLKLQVQDLGLSSSVHFLGFQANPYKYLQKAKLFVLTSLFEGIPTIVIESLLLGVPVISTDCKTGPREILEDSEYGVLLADIDENDAVEVEHSVAESIVELLEDKGKYEHFSQKARQRAKTYAPETVLAEWLRIIECNSDSNRVFEVQ